MLFAKQMTFYMADGRYVFPGATTVIKKVHLATQASMNIF